MGELPEIDMDALEAEIIGEARRRFDRKRARIYAMESNVIVGMIIRGAPRGKVERHIRRLRRLVLRDFPEQEELFDGLYLARFNRIWRQFREADGPTLEG